jgi:hypothetical protein
MNSRLTPKRYTWPEVWQFAEDFRAKFNKPPERIPVPIENIIEFELGVEIRPIPNLKVKCDIEGFLSSNLKTIFVDEYMYNDDRYENRLRFTLAHEVGHLILHEDEIRKMEFRNSKDWLDFNSMQKDEDIEWFERQAKQFAGRLLVPKDPLKRAIESLSSQIDEFRGLSPEPNDDLLLEILAKKICKSFGVSHEVIKRRIVVEKLLPQ